MECKGWGYSYRGLGNEKEKEPFDSEPALASLLTSTSFPVVLGDLLDVT